MTLLPSPTTSSLADCVIGHCYFLPQSDKSDSVLYKAFVAISNAGESTFLTICYEAALIFQNVQGILTPS